MWHGRSPRIHMKFRVSGEPGCHSRIQTVSPRWPVKCAISSFCLTRHHTQTLSNYPHGSILVILPIQGTQFGYLADYGHFSKREVEAEDSCRINSHGKRDGDASTSPGRGAAGFGPRTPHILRRSCVVSLQ